MVEVLVFIVAMMLAVVVGLAWKRRIDARRALQVHSITAEKLHESLGSGENLIVLDVRLPLDFLVDTEIIPGARRIAPSEIVANPALISKDKDYVLYCTCPGNKTSQIVLGKALKFGLLNVSVLTGGLRAWKEKGYAVEFYDKPFQLDVR